MSEDNFGYDDEPHIIITEKSRFEKIEELILPLIQNLIDSSDKDKINWPNRREPLEKLKSEILKLTRNNK